MEQDDILIRYTLSDTTEIASTGEEIGRGSYGRVFKVNYYGTLCAAKEIHSILLESVGRQELERTKITYLRSFLTHRLQRVVVNGTYSDWLSVRSGVPQGSVLGPLLFLLYIDLHSIVKHSKLKLYADDVALYREIKSEADCQLLQDDLDLICGWAKKWQLRLNVSKYEALLISNKRRPMS